MITKSQQFAKTNPTLILLIGFSLKIEKNSHRALRNTPHSPRLPSRVLFEHYEAEVGVSLRRSV